MYKFAVIMSHICGITSLVGLICVFAYPPLALFFAGFSLFVSVMNVWFGDQNGFVTEIIAIGVGLLIGLLFEVDVILAIAGALCALDVILTVVGWSMMLFSFNTYR